MRFNQSGLHTLPHTSIVNVEQGCENLQHLRGQEYGHDSKAGRANRFLNTRATMLGVKCGIGAMS